MNNLKHPNFILGIVSFVILFIGIGMRANSYESGTYVIILSVILGAIQWIWCIVDVVKRGDMKPFQKRFWLIAVITVPALGSMIFYIMHQRRGKIVT